MKASDDEKGNKNIFHTTNIVTIENIVKQVNFLNILLPQTKVKIYVKNSINTLAF